MVASIKKDNKWINAQRDFVRAAQKYEAFFGKGTLERVIYFDPLCPQADDFIDAASLLRRAIKTNKPLEQIPKEMWNNLVF